MTESLGFWIQQFIHSKKYSHLFSSSSYESENPKEVEEVKSGKERKMRHLVGQVMKYSGGKAHPKKVDQIMQQLLKK